MAEKTVPHTEQSLTQVALNLGLHPDAAINQGPPEGKGKGVTIGRSRILLPPASVTTLCGTSLRPSEGSVGAMLTSEVLCRRGGASAERKRERGRVCCKLRFASYVCNYETQGQGSCFLMGESAFCLGVMLRRPVAIV